MHGRVTSSAMLCRVVADSTALAEGKTAGDRIELPALSRPPYLMQNERFRAQANRRLLSLMLAPQRRGQFVSDMVALAGQMTGLTIESGELTDLWRSLIKTNGWLGDDTTARSGLQSSHNPPPVGADVPTLPD